VQPIFIVLIIIAVAVIGYLAYQHEQKRRRLLRAWARSKGFVMMDGKRRDWEIEYPAFKLFERGHSRHTSLHLEGEVDGRRTRCLDYRYTTGSGKNRKVHRHAVVLLDTGTPVVPLQIRREHVFDRVGEFFGHDDIDFESSEFSRRWHVSSTDRKWAYDVIHTGTMDYLLEAPAVTIAFGYQEIAVWVGGQLTGEKCQQCLKIAREMLALVPADVLAQLRGE
jgi:hypothetical protein